MADDTMEASAFEERLEAWSRQARSDLRRDYALRLMASDGVGLHLDMDSTRRLARNALLTAEALLAEAEKFDQEN